MIFVCIESTFFLFDNIIFVFLYIVNIVFLQTYLFRYDIVLIFNLTQFFLLYFSSFVSQSRSRRYANHPSGKKYAKDGSVRPQSADALYSEKARSARVFKEVRDRAAKDEKYVTMRKTWRSNE